MSPLAPETAVSTLAQAPPDRPTSDLEQALNTARAIIFRDGGIDKDEMRVFRQFVEEIAMAAQNGGIGTGATPGAGPGGEPPPSPMDMNQNTEDMGTVEGAEPEDTGGY
jgi:hypothetical protein